MRAAQRVVVITMAGLALALPAPSIAATGGATAPGSTRVTTVHCFPTPEQPCAARNLLSRGGRVRVRGRGLSAAKTLVFRGGRGRRDDAVARVRHLRANHFEAVVPAEAQTGRVDVVTKSGMRAPAPRRVRVAAPEAASPGDAFFAGAGLQPSFTVATPTAGSVELVRDDTGTVVRAWPIDAGTQPVTVSWDGQTATGPAPSGRYTFRLANGAQASASTPTMRSIAYYDHIFPIRGRHDLRQSATNNFGGERNHQGQDMFAGCGTPLVAARGGRVRYAGYRAQAGNYVVVTSADTGLDYVYMHMRSAPLVTTRELVATGQLLGEVGDSGNASGCHLHFELWSAPGWYSGGAAIDPLARLRAWDTWS